MVRQSSTKFAGLPQWLMIVAAQQKTLPGQTIKANRNNVFNPDNILAMLSGSYGLILHELDVDLFLQRARNLTGADSAALIRWLGQHPVVELCDCVGERPLKLPADIKILLNDSLPEPLDLPAPMHEVVQDSAVTDHKLRKHFADPHLLAILLDTHPSRLLIVLSRNPENKPWTDDERHSFLAITRVMRQSVRLHKRVDSMRGIIETATALLNSSPSGMVIMQPDGTINIANREATRILNSNDGICIQNDRLHIRDRTLSTDFAQVLQAAPDMPAETAREFQWYRAIPRVDHKTPYQLSVQILCLREWHIESREYDKVVVVFLAEPASLAVPTADQLQQYYGFTDAQAKLALALWGGKGIKEAAEKLCVSINTARTHLRAIYAKVGVANHAELMAVLTTSLNRVRKQVSRGEFYEDPRHHTADGKPPF